MDSLDKAHYKAIIQSSFDAIIGKDLDGIITLWNPAAEALYGYTPSEVLGEKITIIFPDDLLYDFKSIMAKIKKGQHIENYETVRITKNKKKVQISLSISPVRDKSGKIVGASTIARNITLQKKNQLLKDFLITSGETLASSLDHEKTLRNIAKLVVPDIADWCAIDILNEKNQIERLAVAHKDPKKVSWALELQEKYPPDPTEKMGLYEVVRTGELQYYPDITPELLDIADLDDEERRLVKKIGIKSVIIAPLAVHAKTFGAITLANTENTHRFTPDDCRLATELARRAATAIENSRLFGQVKRANDELEAHVENRTRELRAAITELERSNRELDDFAKVASHDMIEPLRKISAFGDLLRKHQQHKIDEKSKQYLDRIIRSSERMRSLIEGLLTYSRVSSSTSLYSQVDLQKLVNEVMDDLEFLIVDTDAKVKVGELPTVEADELQMRQVFQNLISNAIKFNKPGEKPIVHIYCCKENGSNKTRICVEDKGIGFDEKYKDRIFGVFERLHSKAKFEGTGIGLAVVHKIINRHGGDITVSSKPGEGTTFKITLPKIQENFKLLHLVN